MLESEGMVNKNPRMAGFVQLLPLIIVSVALVGSFYLGKEISEKQEERESRIPSVDADREVVLPSPTPTAFAVKKTKKSVGKTHTSNNKNQIICVGPDGKEFLTTKDECKKLNNAWGKPMDMIVDCKIHPNCGGGTRRMRKSECDRSICCEIGGKWYFYSSREKCTEDQKKYWNSYYDKYYPITNSYRGNFNYPTLAPLPTFGPLPTIEPPPDLSSFYSKLDNINRELEKSMSEYTKKIEESSKLDIPKTRCYWKHYTFDEPEWVCESF